MCVFVCAIVDNVMIIKQWRNTMTGGGPWTNYIKGLKPHFAFTEKFIIIKVLTKVTIKRTTLMKCEVK